MRHVKTILFLACCLLAGAGIAQVFKSFFAKPPVEPPPTYHTGVGDPPPLHGFYLSLDGASAQAFSGFVPLHASAVALVAPRNGNLAALVAAAAQAHCIGLKVVLLPPPAFSITNPYPAPLAAIASDAAAAHVDYLCISWINADPEPAYWHAQAAIVRNAFSGKLILAATADELPALDRLDCADFIAAIGPIDLPRRLPSAPANVNLDDLRVGWACRLDELESLAVKHERRLILLHMEVPATLTTKLPPAGQSEAPPTPNPALQRLAYEALLLETKGRESTEGLFLPPPTDPAANAALPPIIENLWSKSKPTTVPATAPAATEDDAPDAN